MKLYVVRHGEVDSNALKRFNLREEDLNKRGIEQANTLAKTISQYKFDVVISSPLIRAMHTAKIITAGKYEILIDERLEERKHRNLIGKPFSSLNREDYWNYHLNLRFENEETVQELFTRVHDFIEKLKTQYKNESILIVAHSGISKAIYAYFNGIPEDGKFLNLGSDNCEVKIYDLK